MAGRARFTCTFLSAWRRAYSSGRDTSPDSPASISRRSARGQPDMIIADWQAGIVAHVKDDLIVLVEAVRRGRFLPGQCRAFGFPFPVGRGCAWHH